RHGPNSGILLTSRRGCAMDDGGEQTVSAGGHEFVDEEAHKISSLILAVQQRCAEGGDRVGADLFAWAEEYSRSGRRAEAEFLYLHAMGWCERLYGVVYPIMFRGLRDYAVHLLERIREQNSAVREPALLKDTLKPAA